MNKMQQHIVGAALEYLMSQDGKDRKDRDEMRVLSNRILDVLACFDNDITWGETEHIDMIDTGMKRLHRELYRKIVWR